MTDFTLQHEIFILDAYLTKALDATQRHVLTQQFIDVLIAKLGMEELGPLQVHDATDPRAPGWSFVQPITTSHISGHYFEKPGPKPHMRLDCYSCTSYDWQIIVDVCDEFLSLDEWRATSLHRHIDITDPRTVSHIEGKGTDVLVEYDLQAVTPENVSEKLTKQLVKEAVR